MTEQYRHHRVSREIIFVEVPLGGSPKLARTVKPGPYPVDRRGPWRPRVKPPSRKTEGFKRMLDLMRDLDRRANDARAMLHPLRL